MRVTGKAVFGIDKIEIREGMYGEGKTLASYQFTEGDIGSLRDAVNKTMKLISKNRMEVTNVSSHTNELFQFFNSYSEIVRNRNSVECKKAILSDGSYKNTYNFNIITLNDGVDGSGKRLAGHIYNKFSRDSRANAVSLMHDSILMLGVSVVNPHVILD